jgi:hypothetical protein
MRTDVTRRSFIQSTALLGAAGIPYQMATAQPTADGPRAFWPAQDPAAVKEVVTVAHFDLARVRTLVERQPTLVSATYDWGFGDWEDPLGAAAHTGRREIAEFLLAHGARPSLFAAAMLGQLDVVKALVAASPGCQRSLGAHAISLLQHARAGGPQAEAVVKYLESLGDAGRQPANAPLDARDRDLVVGRYRFGDGPRDYFDVDLDKERLGIVRPDTSRRNLFHVGGLVFHPAGAPAVRIAFLQSNGKVTRMTIADPDVYIRAERL